MAEESANAQSGAPGTNPATILLEMAQRYKDAGPGTVRVQRITDIQQVRMLRECRDQLTGEEQQYVKTTTEQVTAILRGIEQSQTYQRRDQDSWQKRLMKVLIGAPNPAGVSSKENRMEAEHNQMLSQSGKADLPAPKGMVDAAEAWLTVVLVGGRLPGDYSSLRQPWDSIVIS